MSFAQMHDDNVFATPEAEADDISRLGAGLGVAGHSPRLILKARYAIESEVFRLHPELNRAAARQDAALDLEWTASRRSSVALSAGFLETQTPSELNLLSELEVGRRRGRRLSTGALLTHRLSPLSTATLEHRFSRDRVAGGPGNDAHAAVLGVERRLGPADRVSVEYRAHRFAFDADTTLAHIVSLGWRRTVTPSAQFALEAGPCLSSGRLGAEVSAELRHQLAHGEAAIAYVQSQTTVLGLSGPVTVNGVRAALSHRLVGPLRFGASPAAFRVLGPRSEATLYRLGVEVAWPVARDVTLSGAHQFSLQEGRLAQGAASEIAHNTFVLALTRRSSRE